MSLVFEEMSVIFSEMSVVFEEMSVVFKGHAMGLTKEALFLLYLFPRALHNPHKIIIFAVDLL